MSKKDVVSIVYLFRLHDAWFAARLPSFYEALRHRVDIYGEVYGDEIILRKSQFNNGHELMERVFALYQQGKIEVLSPLRGLDSGDLVLASRNVVIDVRLDPYSSATFEELLVMAEKQFGPPTDPTVASSRAAFAEAKSLRKSAEDAAAEAADKYTKALYVVHGTQFTRSSLVALES